MAGSPRSPLLLLAALALALALAVSPAAGQGHKGRLVGGLIDADVNEEGVQQALSFALSEYNKASNDAYHGRVLRVLRVRKQVRLPRRGRGIELRSRSSGAGRAGCGAREQRPGARGQGAEPECFGTRQGAQGRDGPDCGRPGAVSSPASAEPPGPGRRVPFSPWRLGGICTDADALLTLAWPPGLSRRPQPFSGCHPEWAWPGPQSGSALGSGTSLLGLGGPCELPSR